MNFLLNEEELAFSNGIKALYFYAPWMPFHKKMLTMIGKIEEKYKQIQFLGIDTDHFRGLCKRFNVESIPCILVLKDGFEVKRINGVIMTSAFRSFFADICTPES